MVNITSFQKKWITLGSMLILAASNITTPIDLSGMLPTFLTDPLVAGISVVTAAAYGTVVGAYWIFNKDI